MIELLKDEMPMSVLLLEASKVAKGEGFLLDNKSGERCLWGEACHLIGVKDGWLRSELDFANAVTAHKVNNTFGVMGSHSWDAGAKEKGLELAIKFQGKKSIGEFRKFLRSIGWLKKQEAV